jgi:hypothetical protein
MPENKIQIIIEAINKFEDAFKQFGKSLKDRLNDADNFKLKMTELDSFLKQGIGIGALYGLMREMKESINTAELLQNSLRGLASSARYSGEDIDGAMSEATKAAADGLMDVQKASQSLQNLLSRGFSLQESVDIIIRLKDAAAFNRQASLSMGQAVQSATEGLKNENSILVDNAGVTKNVSVMWKEYAAQIGKGVDSLTQAEKRQAEYNGIMRETEGQMGNAKLAAQGLTGEKARLSAEVFKLKAALGEGLTPAFLLIGKVILSVMEGIKMFLGSIELLGARIAHYFAIWGSFGGWVASGFKGGIAEIKKQQAELDKVLDEQATDIVNKWEGKVNSPDIGKDSGRRRKDTSGGDAGGKNKQKDLIKSWKETSRDLTTDLGQINGDEFDKKISDYENKAIDLKEKFKSVKGAVAEINTWLSGMKGDQFSKATKQNNEAVLKATTEGAKERFAVIDASEKFISERMKTEQEKRIADEQKAAQTEINNLAGELAARNILEEEYDTLATQIREASKKRLLEITQDYNRKILEAETNNQLAVLDAAEKDLSMSKEDVAMGRIAVHTTRLAAYNAELQQSIEKKDDLARMGWEIKIKEENTSLTEQKRIVRELTGAFDQGLIEAIKEYSREMSSSFQYGKQAFKDLASSMKTSFKGILTDLQTGETKNFLEYVKSFCDSILDKWNDMLSEMLTNWVMTGDMMKSPGSSGATGGFIGWISKWLGNGNGSTYTGSGMGGDVDLGFSTTGVWEGYHEGGVIGKTAPTFYRLMPTSIYEDIPRHHQGLLPNEHKAIVEDGETIFPKGTKFSTGGSQGNAPVINNFYTVNAIDAKSFDERLKQSSGTLNGITNDALRNNTGLRNTIKRTR